VITSEHGEAFGPETEDLFVDVALEEQLHHEFLLTLAGVKPVSVTNCGANCARAFDLLRRRGDLANVDLEWMFKDETLVSFSKRAMTRVLSDPKVTRALSEAGAPPLTADTAFAWFADYWSGRDRTSRVTNEPFTQPEFDVISGVFFGFPLADVRAYAGLTATPRSGFDVDLFPNRGAEKFFGWMVVTDDVAPEVQALLARGRAAVETYERLAARGERALSMVKAWPACEVDLIGRTGERHRP
jgi:hypothetical protein